ncbi:Importin 9 [Mortierella sp. GBA30]|nr:Importin 9 [Mortierella sp. GBA30]
MLRASQAYVVSKIAHLDWPDSWPDLLDILMNHLQRGSANEIHGSMRVLAEFVSKDITHNQLPIIIPVLFPELLRILSSDQVYPPSTRSRCVSIFRSAVDMLFTIKEEHPEAVRTYLAPIFDQWNNVFLAVLNKSSGMDAAEWGLKAEIIRCIVLSIQGFPKLTAPYVLPVLAAVWKDVVQLRPRYISECVSTNTDSTADVCQDSEGESVGLQSLLFAQFEFIQMACHRRKITQSTIVGLDGRSGIMRELIWNMLNFMQITDEQVEAWDADPNQFIADEEEETYSVGARMAARNIVLTLVDNFRDQALQALSLAVNQEMMSSVKEKANRRPHWWKIQESNLLAVGLVAEEIGDILLLNGKGGQQQRQLCPIDVGALFDHVVFANLSAHDVPFLQGRSFVFASQFAKLLPSNLASQYVSAAVEAILRSPSAVVKISALKALNNFNRHLDKQYIVPYQRPILQGIAPMIVVTTEETFNLVVRTLITTFKLDEQVASEFEPVLGPLIMDSWVKYRAEHSMSADIVDLFDTLAANPYSNSAFSARALPALVNIITVDNPDIPLVSDAIDLLKALIQGGHSPLPTGNDASSGKSGLELLIQFIAKLLDPSQTESAALFVGDLISKLIKKGGVLVSSVLPDILNAVTIRLAQAKLPSFIQPLVMVFAQLCIDQHETVINFLSGININGRSGLDIVLVSWLLNHADFQGIYHQKVSVVALSKVFSVADARIFAIPVKGDMIVSNSSRRMTRSTAKSTPNQYTLVTVPVKIIKLFTMELTNRIEEEEEGEYADDDDDYGDEDDEEDEGSNEDPTEESKKHGRIGRNKDRFAFLSDIVDEHGQYGGVDYFDEDGGFEEEEESDTDVRADPIYLMNMKAFLIDFFRSQISSPVLVQCVAELSEVERSTLSRLLES